MKRFATLAVAVMFTLGAASAAEAGVIGELGVLLDTANGGINPVTSVAWAPGDTYRLGFVTSGTRDATSPDIAVYDAFVQAAAGAVGWGAGTWRCVGQSSNNPSAQTNTGTTPPGGVGIFLVDGVTKIADDNADMWSGNNVWNITETLLTYGGSVGTGAGRLFGDPLQPKIEHGRQPDNWWRVYNGAQTSQWHFYAISEDLTTIPEPATLALLGLGGLGLIARRRRR